jgi:UDP-N-acetylglucosamine diphosphorylase/glucosamine-1-phosphate N-acetyltransferase
MDVVVFEDDRSEDLWPANLTRPTATLSTAGASVLDLVALLGLPVRGLVRPYLREVAARHMRLHTTHCDESLYVNAALVPDLRYVGVLEELAGARGHHLWASDGRLCAAKVPAGVAAPDELSPPGVESWLLETGPPAEEAGLALLRYPHDLVRFHRALVEGNIAVIAARGEYEEVREGVLARGCPEIAGSAVLDASGGAIVLEDSVQIGEFAYIAGPAYVGRGSRLTDRASIKDGVVLGRVCKVGGEVECTTFMPYSNKQHHGFIGHAFIGSWVNMGAGTSNSDLKNTYGLVRVEHRGRRLETGMQFLGCVIGDFSKTAINSSIFTGKVVGVASMVYGTVTRNVPSFCNWAHSFGQVTECPADKAVETQKRMFARRGVQQEDADVRLLHDVFELTRAERLMSSEPPQL